MTQEATLVMRNSLTEIPRVAETVEGFFEANDLPRAACMHVTLALDELVTNAISYGFPAGAELDGAIVIRLSLIGGDLVAVMEDRGKPFDPLSVPEPDLDLGVEDREIGGLGVHFVRQFMTETRYERVDGVNRLTMRKGLARPSPA